MPHVKKQHVQNIPFEHGAAPLAPSEYGCEDPWPGMDDEFTDDGMSHRTSLPTNFIPDQSDEITQALGEESDSFAALAARFEKVGSTGNMWEHERKVQLAEITESLRAQFAQRGEKVTEQRLDNMAHCDPAYKRFVMDGIHQKEEYHRQFIRRIDHYTTLRELNNKGMR
jgi:hypothetical protein